MWLARNGLVGMLAIGFVWGVPGTQPAQAAPALGLVDDPAFSDFRAPQRRLALDRAEAAGAGLIRFTLDWSVIAPGGDRKPDGFTASDPSDSGYKWGYAEEFVRDARGRGLDVLFTVVRAPEWAEGGSRPAGAPPGSWRPDPDELAVFVRAAARRFSGFYPDPQSGGEGAGRALPRVRHWQIWDEPNAGETLTPATGAATRYREMLDGAARALGAVDGGNVVVTAGTAAGNVPTPPMGFWRRLLCLRGGCDGPVRFDAFAHHPVAGSSSPSRRGSGADLRIADLPRLTRLVSRARKRGKLSGGPKRLWVTDIHWDSAPPSPRGVPLERQADHLTRGLFSLIRGAGAERVIWSGLRDHGAIRSGLYRSPREGDARKDRPKPALAAFRFPFLVEAGRGGVTRAWGISPRRARQAVAIQRRAGARWRTVRRIRSRAGGQFTVRVGGGAGRYRAVAGGLRSRPWVAR